LSGQGLWVLWVDAKAKLGRNLSHLLGYGF